MALSPAVELQMKSIAQVTGTFVALKSVLFALLGFQGIEFDTSSNLLFPNSTAAVTSDEDFSQQLVSFYENVLKKSCIWDAVFHVTGATRPEFAPDYEHEWAFGVGWNRVIRVVSDALFARMDNAYEKYTLGAIFTSTASHYIGCILFYYLTMLVYPSLSSSMAGSASGAGSRLAMKSLDLFARKSAMLYVITPAGVFMSAGYAEPLFACLSFLGLILRALNRPTLAGFIFGLSCLIRSNGLFWGFLYLYDLACFFFPSLAVTAVAGAAPQPATQKRKSGKQKASNTTKQKGKNQQQQDSFWELLRILVGGGFIALGFFSVQFYAYRVYCTGTSFNPFARKPEWCAYRLPLIYSYIQSRYWNVGMFRYWTLNNIPNFLFALPTLYLMYLSAVASPPDGGAQRILMPLRIVQTVMLVSALFTWHIQIVTRVVSSTSPLIYWFVEEGLRKSKSLKKARFARRVVRFWMVWIVVQGLLFSVYLPPA
ncbi:hypothetical protein D0Z00_002665 [Geotrichum galactomycetum]|uniref:Uncharacterized protein n=1 Tax=Geotrichum galactomycetum TaxID=27317 RepID=A0ACB6V3I5_9ASCO|nr:hypothetical protein D0Z00_002665 [Geotrichum candidum]